MFIFYYTILYSTIPYCTVPYCTILIQYAIIYHGSILMFMWSFGPLKTRSNGASHSTYVQRRDHERSACLAYAASPLPGPQKYVKRWPLRLFLVVWGCYLAYFWGPGKARARMANAVPQPVAPPFQQNQSRKKFPHFPKIHRQTFPVTMQKPAALTIFFGARLILRTSAGFDVFPNSYRQKLLQSRRAWILS